MECQASSCTWEVEAKELSRDRLGFPGGFRVGVFAWIKLA